jgi:DNA repair protein RecO (recombination protein O)
MPVHLQPAYVLHSRPFRETSLIFDVLTEEYGKVTLIAKGVRNKKSRTAALLQPFMPLLISYVGKSELKNLSHVELNPPVTEIKGMPLYCGFYLNELLNHFLQSNDPCPEIYQDYCQCLNLLQNNSDNIESVLRLFELNLLESLGYGLQLTHDFQQENPIDANEKYHYIPDQGPVVAENGHYSGMTLKALQTKILDNQQSLTEAKRLMRQMIDFHLQGRQLKSRSLIRAVQSKIKK